MKEIIHKGPLPNDQMHKMKTAGGYTSSAYGDNVVYIGLKGYKHELTKGMFYVANMLDRISGGNTEVGIVDKCVEDWYWFNADDDEQHRLMNKGQWLIPRDIWYDPNFDDEWMSKFVIGEVEDEVLEFDNHQLKYMISVHNGEEYNMDPRDVRENMPEKIADMWKLASPKHNEFNRIQRMLSDERGKIMAPPGFISNFHRHHELEGVMTSLISGCMNDNKDFIRDLTDLEIAKYRDAIDEMEEINLTIKEYYGIE